AKLRQNLDDVSVSRDIPVTFLDFSYVDMEHEPLSAYSILGMNDEAFEIIVVDILRDGEGSGIWSIDEGVLDKADNMGNGIEEAIKYGLIDIESLLRGKVVLLKYLETAQIKARERLRELQSEAETISDEEVKFLEYVRNEFSDFRNFLTGPYGDIVFRIVYRDYYRPIFENKASLDKGSLSSFDLDMLYEQGLSFLDYDDLKRGARLVVGDNTFIEIRINGDTAIMQMVGTDFPEEFEEVCRILSAEFERICTEYEVSSEFAHGEIQPQEPIYDAYSLLALTDEEFAAVCRDTIKDGTTSGYFGVDSEIIDFIAVMYDDLVVNEAKKKNISAEFFLQGKAQLLRFIRNILAEGTISGNTEERLAQYRNYARVLLSERGNLIYRIFYRDFLRTDPLIIKILDKKIS
ncbi:MAG: hypothetical protein NTZ48_00520, partial [Candidatus Omnitrophica bacterium]|nr:hypothetical protein [Candidatus Omnitrophota bacterium]